MTVADNRTFDDADSLARGAAEWLCALATASNRAFSVCLSGGSTPKRLYRHLADPLIASRFPWNRTHWFWGDERFVPHDHPDSNYRMIRETLLASGTVNPRGVFAYPEDGTPEAAAETYEEILRQQYGSSRLLADPPLFDLMLLGLGEDGHTASLLPDQPVLEERQRWVAPVPDGRIEPRISLTYPALESSRHTLFLVGGAAKKEALARARAGDQTLPAGRLKPQGDVIWLVDRAAAGIDAD